MNHCSFCSEPSVIGCMNRSLYHKHCDDEDKSGQIIDLLIQRDNHPAFTKYTEVVVVSDHREFMNMVLKGKMLTREFSELLEYYKYRFFVPMFSKSKSTDTVLAYYYDKLKNYYNGIKRKLNITVQQSSVSSSSGHFSQSDTNFSTKQEILKDLKKQLEQEEKKEKKKKKKSSIVQYKTQSKALEEMICYMKLNPKFQEVKTLKTEDCFEQGSIFMDNIQNKDIFKEENILSSARTAIKTKIFKKFIEGALRKRQTPTYAAEKSRQRPASRSKSIKVINFKGSKDYQMHRKAQKQPLPKPNESKVKQYSSLKVLPKRNISLGKINQNKHYSSPYEKKSSSTDKKKVVTTFLTRAGRSGSTDNQKFITIAYPTKKKETVISTNFIKFQNTIPFKSTPNSPSSRRLSRPQIKIAKNDNILTIRKKKLEAMKQKVAKK